MNRIETGCLVVYKSRPARVTGVSDKIDISFPGGSKRVREKDVQFLHPGPVASLDNLEAGPGELDEAVETIAELVDRHRRSDRAWRRKQDATDTSGSVTSRTLAEDPVTRSTRPTRPLSSMTACPTVIPSDEPLLMKRTWSKVEGPDE